MQISHMAIYEIPSENGVKPLDLEKKQYNNNKLINK